MLASLEMTKKLSLVLILAAAFALAAEDTEVPRFAVIADVQYADKPAQGKREYRESRAKLSAAVSQINRQDVDFVLQLGDLIDEGVDNLAAILPVYQGFRSKKYHVLGNHDFGAGRAALLERLGMRGAYYDFSLKGWRFIVLDGMDVSVEGGWPAGSPNLLAGERMLASLRAHSSPNAMPWNGGIGEEQKRWLRDTLQAAERAGERVIVFCHFPVLAAASTPVHLLWNHDELLGILSSSPAVAAFMNGHDHQGGYAEEGGIHFLTFQGIVESGADTAYAVVEVFPNRLEIRGTGTVPSRSLALSAPGER
jgi:manganese-dependent ADP-ribose/CDP-alcohol diphosphatase